MADGGRECCRRSPLAEVHVLWAVLDAAEEVGGVPNLADLHGEEFVHVREVLVGFTGRELRELIGSADVLVRACREALLMRPGG